MKRRSKDEKDWSRRSLRRKWKMFERNLKFLNARRKLLKIWSWNRFMILSEFRKRFSSESWGFRLILKRWRRELRRRILRSMNDHTDRLRLPGSTKRLRLSFANETTGLIRFESSMQRTQCWNVLLHLRLISICLSWLSLKGKKFMSKRSVSIRL